MATSSRSKLILRGAQKPPVHSPPLQITFSFQKQFHHFFYPLSPSYCCHLSFSCNLFPVTLLRIEELDRISEIQIKEWDEWQLGWIGNTYFFVNPEWKGKALIYCKCFGREHASQQHYIFTAIHFQTCCDSASTVIELESRFNHLRNNCQKSWTLFRFCKWFCCGFFLLLLLLLNSHV